MPEYAIIDVETTGGSPAAHKIIEIAVVISDGEKIIDRYSSLIHPERNIPYFISSLTGIDGHMLDSAPKFFEVAKKVFELTENRIFVAHNVNFDYSFVRKEFAELGGKFQRKKICTVRLSRRAFPGLKSYSLGKICSHLGIAIENRHRALGDAEATTLLLHQCLKKESPEILSDKLQKKYEARLPPNLPVEEFEKLPTRTGVYYFRDKGGKVIYVGKAKDIKKRVWSHFDTGEQMHKRNFLEGIYSVDYQLCGNELIALLLESCEIKRLWPRYNISQKRLNGTAGIYTYTDKQGYERLVPAMVKKGSRPLITFANLSECRSFLNRLVYSHKLCSKLCGLQNVPDSCFGYQTGTCTGACVGHEDPVSYNLRYIKAMESFSHEGKSFVIKGKGRNAGEKSVVWVEDGAFRGFGFIPDDAQMDNQDSWKDYVQSYPDNADIQNILAMYLRSAMESEVIYYDPCFNSTVFG
ncbi:MAG: GIY-YIG nuclease family protein [Cyclobacteriaceae bacterium]|nr:GIY-YIG nuclease family protein [Cyclobacteriaceae bacterium]